MSSRKEVCEILLASGVPTAVLNAAIVIGSGSASFEMLRYLTERLPVMITPRWVRNRVQPISELHTDTCQEKLWRVIEAIGGEHGRYPFAAAARRRA